MMLQNLVNNKKFVLENSDSDQLVPKPQDKKQKKYMHSDLD